MLVIPLGFSADVECLPCSELEHLSSLEMAFPQLQLP
jgi:hypothetical protein